MKDQTTMIKWMTAATLLLGGSGALAQTSAKEGLERLKSNYENSKLNHADYQKNLKI